MKFYPSILSRTTDELIVIANFPEDWNPKAVEQAAKELEKRNVSIEEQKIRAKEIQDTVDEFNRLEYEQRQHESYSIHDLVIMAFYLPRTLLTDWFLKKEGYHKLYKQRLGSILAGIVFYFFMFSWINWSADKEEINRLNAINRADIYEWELNNYSDDELRIIRKKEIQEVFEIIEKNERPTFLIIHKDTISIAQLRRIQEDDPLTIRNIFIEQLAEPKKHNRIEIVMVNKADNKR